MILTEMSTAQRSMIIKLVHAEMERMRDNDPNSWTTFEYAQLEDMSRVLFLDCAE